MKTRTTFILSLTTILTLAAGSTFGAYSGGKGRPNDPYLISTPADMNQIGRNYTDWDKCFKLTADINLSAYTGTQFSRIGTDASHAFSGVFDGNMHTISGFTYTAPARDYIGVFGNSRGIIENISLVDVNVTGRSYVGGLVGYLEGSDDGDGEISNCSSAGVIHGGDNSRYIGGLVGCASNNYYWCYINNCYSTSAITGGNGSAYLGGLVGQIVYGDISYCYSTGAVSGGDDSYDLGGLVGGIGSTDDDESESYISNCYSTGAVTGGYDSDSLGGLVGYVNSYGDVMDCYATGEVAGDYDVGGLVGLKESYGPITTCYSSGSVSGYMFVGGLVGWDNGGQETTDSFWDTDTSGQSWSDGGTGKTTAEMKTKSTFTDAGWNFDYVWHICEGTNYPRLLWSISAADLVCPDGVNFVDFAVFAKSWLNTGLAPTVHGIVIGNWESPDSSDGWGGGSNDPCAILVPDSNIGVTLGHGSLKLTPVTDGAFWELMWQGVPSKKLINANIQFDLTMVASEWPSSPWTQVGAKIAINSNGPSGWKEYGPDSGSSVAYSCIDRDTGEASSFDWGAWEGDANKTYSYNVSDYDATGATWMQIVISVQDGNVLDGGSFYFDKAIVTSPNAPPLGPPSPDFDLSGTVDIADLEIFCNEWLKEQSDHNYQKCTLTINIEGSGSVNKDPNKAIYDFGETVQLTANPATGGSFNYWIVNGKYTPKNPITITMYGNMTITADFNYVTDTTPPSPNPMTWASEPNAISGTEITMTATTATDAQGPVQYYFTNKTDPSHNSGWQLSPTYTDTGLTPGTTYTYNVRARDSAAPVPNITTASADANATTNRTADTNAPTPNPMTWASGPNAISDTQITMTATTATDAQGPVQYYFTNKTDPSHNSGWQTSPTYTDTGLTPMTKYSYTVKARDNALVPNITVASVEANAVTLADTTPPTPNPMTFRVEPYATGPSSIKMEAEHAADASGSVQYQFRYSTGGLAVCKDWGYDTNFTDTGLNENSIYGYQVRAKDTVGNVTAWSAAASATTSRTLQTQINQAIAARGGSPYAPITIVAAAGTYNEDVELNEPNITLQSASGAAVTIIQLVSADANGINIKAPGCTIGGSSGHGFTIKSAITGTIALIGAGQNNTVVSYCDLNSVGSASIGVRVNKATGVTIANNNFANDGNGVYLGGGLVKSISIINNTFTKVGTDANFVKIDRSDANNIAIIGNMANEGMSVVVGPNDTNLVNLTISNNTFTRGGILLSSPSVSNAYAVDANRMRNVTISNNTFSAGSTDTALVIDTIKPADVNWSGVSFTGNSILRSPGGALVTVDNIIGATAATLLAPHNYWGATDGPIGSGCGVTGGASVSTFVTYQPFWTNDAMTIDANCTS